MVHIVYTQLMYSTSIYIQCIYTVYPSLSLSSGIYSPEDYSIAVPLAIITLPAGSILSNTHASPFTALPVDLQQALLHWVRGMPPYTVLHVQYMRVRQTYNVYTCPCMYIQCTWLHTFTCRYADKLPQQHVCACMCLSYSYQWTKTSLANSRWYSTY